ncbi:MAG: hypothetical protein HOV87_19130 [Catenulispora sp.]|nr:hypothetical protein [Catenulispora sp.]
MSRPFIAQGGIHFVPVLRHRLNFAVMVQRAVHDLGLDEHDLIAVALPESVREPMLQAIGRLPRVNLVISAVSTGEQREVFPVTPSDALVEAVRTAAERGIPLRFLDQEVAPAHLIDHFCLADNAWPDDGLALRTGAERYLDLVARRLSRPPSRFEPVDAWRELHMAAELRRLHPKYRRILFVCNATHVRPIQELLRQPASLAEPAPAALPPPRFEIVEPSLPILLSYLDEIPRLVQEYEQARAAGAGHTFDKHAAVLRAVYQLSEEATDLRISVRHLKAFAVLLAGLLEPEGRTSPHLADVVDAAGTCFSSAFRERVYRRLLSYHDQVRVERIGRIVGNGEVAFWMSQSVGRAGAGHGGSGASGRVYVARSCMQPDHYYEVTVGGGRGDDAMAPDVAGGQIIEWQPAGADADMASRAQFDQSWPPTDAFINEMRHKALRLATTDRNRVVRSVEFHGTLHDGLDFRRTLRSVYQGRPKLYVRQEKVSRLPKVDMNEPTVWLSDDYAHADVTGGGFYVTGTFSGNDTVTFPTELHMIRSEPSKVLTNKYGNRARLSSHEVVGRLTFKDWGQTTDETRAKLGDSIRTRLPDYQTVYFPSEYLSRLADRYGVNLSMARWWEFFLVAALSCARDTVVLVAPPHFTVPDAARAVAASSGKRIVQVPTTYYTQEELRRVRSLYYLAGAYPGPVDDANDIRMRNYIVERFSEPMKSYW